MLNNKIISSPLDGHVSFDDHSFYCTVHKFMSYGLYFIFFKMLFVISLTVAEPLNLKPVPFPGQYLVWFSKHCFSYISILIQVACGGCTEQSKLSEFFS